MRTKFFRHGTGISMLIASAAFLMPLALAGRTQATTISQCVGQHTSCLQNCNRYPNGAFYNSCMQRCGSQLDNCMSAVLPDTPGKVDTGGSQKPPRPTDNSAPTTGGKKDEKIRSQGTDNRAPLGGVFKSSAPSSGSNNGGPILRSNVSSPKSASGNGPSFRSGGRN